MNEFNGPIILLASRLVPMCDPAGEIFMNLTSIFHSLTGHILISAGWQAEGCLSELGTK